MLSDQHLKDIAARSTAPVFGQAPGCVKVGQYRRIMPVTMARMMENALDWEHLPTLHADNFASIDLIDSGPWGWRATADLPSKGGGAPTRSQIIELLLDTQNHCWVTTILGGTGAGNQIHTQARMVADDQLEVCVDFYVPDSGFSDEQYRQYGEALSAVYAQLYDEDEGMMARRQDEMDAWAAARRSTPPADGRVDVGALEDLQSAGAQIVPFGGGRFKLLWDGDAVSIFSVRCPHMLGPLDDEEICDGRVACPWHGYVFDTKTGRCDGHPGLRLETPPHVTVSDGRIILSAEDQLA